MRVELSDGLVLEASFGPLEPLSALRDLVAACLVPDAAKGFYLFTAPPKARLVRPATRWMDSDWCAARS